MAQNIRPAAVAGKFYDASTDALRKSVKQCYGEAATIAPLSKAERTEQEKVRAVIVPHAGYVFSGAVAATAYMRIPENAHYERIFLIGPSHHVAFDGASVAEAFDAYRTPLGEVPVDTDVCRELIERDNVFRYNPSAHDREHCLEVQLPFLQYRMKEMPKIVPIILGTENMTLLKRVAEALIPYFTDENLFVISSDFSHYPSYDDAETVDGNTGRGLENGNINEFIKALVKNNSLHISNLYTSACGQSAIAVLLLLAQDSESDSGRMKPGLLMNHIAYLNSGDSPYGGKDEVVGYQSFVLNEKLKVKSEKLNGENEKLKVENEKLGAKSDEFVLSDEDKRQLINVAWNAISPADRHRKVVPTDVFERKLGVFVTLTEHGKLRGCIGHFGEDVPLGQITDAMAHAAAFEDPRFTPLRPDELDDIDIEISVLTPLKRIHDISEFHYGTDGIYIKKGYRSGTFLPQVADEVDWTKEEFLGHCSRDKAGLGWDGWKTAELYTYQALRFSTEDGNFSDEDGKE